MRRRTRATTHEAGLEGTGLRYESATFLRVLMLLTRYAADPRFPILIEGESGTGKTTIARLIHQLSPRARGPFHVLAVPEIDDNLTSTDLFGHVRGAFTDAKAPRAGAFLSASHGTLFLDELGKATPPVQRRLLRVIEDGEIRHVGDDHTISVDVRVIAASNTPLADLCKRGAFLPDLYARLEAYRVRLPSLRERRPDIPVLARAMLVKHARDFEYDEPPSIEPELMHLLRHATWPNNLRELDSTIRRLVLFASGAPMLTAALFQQAFEGEASANPRGRVDDRQIEEALLRAGNNKSEAARQLGIDRSTLWRRTRHWENGHPPAPPR